MPNDVSATVSTVSQLVVRPAAETGLNKQQVRPSTLYPSERGLRRLVFVADVKDWAFDNIALNIADALSPRFDVGIAYERDFGKDLPAFYHHVFFELRPQHVHFLWRGAALRWVMAAQIWASMLERYQISTSDFARSISSIVVTTSIYDHLHSQPHEIAAVRNKLTLLDGVSTSSNKLYDIYSEQCAIPVGAVLSDGVDLELFYPQRLERFQDHERTLVIGWVGNSRWNHSTDRDRKGFLTITKPTVDALTSEGVPVVGRYADRSEIWLPRSAMPAYYQSIDILVCSSETEGTPNPVLEAMACGVPVISTEVGIVREVFGPKQREYILRERSHAALREAILKLVRNRDHLAILSAENLGRIANWSWRDKAPRWEQFFAAARRLRQENSGRDEAMISEIMALGGMLRDTQSKLATLREHHGRQKQRIGELREQRDRYRLRSQRYQRYLEKPAKLIVRILRAVKRRLIGPRARA